MLPFIFVHPTHQHTPIPGESGSAEHKDAISPGGDICRCIHPQICFFYGGFQEFSDRFDFAGKHDVIFHSTGFQLNFPIDLCHGMGIDKDHFFPGISRINHHLGAGDGFGISRAGNVIKIQIDLQLLHIPEVTPIKGYRSVEVDFKFDNIAFVGDDRLGEVEGPANVDGIGRVGVIPRPFVIILWIFQLDFRSCHKPETQAQEYQDEAKDLVSHIPSLCF